MELNLYEMRAIMNGANPVIVEACGADFALESLSEGANIQAMKLKLSRPMKDAKSKMKQAKKAAKAGNNAEAKKLYTSAIADLNTLKKEAEDIEDDHIVMVMVDAFVRASIPLIAGTLVTLVVPGVVGTIAYWSSIVGSWICGMSKVYDFAAAIDKGLTAANKAGKDGTVDSAMWWKIGETRGAVMTKLDRMITVCEIARDKL